MGTMDKPGHGAREAIGGVVQVLDAYANLIPAPREKPWAPDKPAPGSGDWYWVENTWPGAAIGMKGACHLLLGDLRRVAEGSDALLTAESGCCIVLSINDNDDGITLYTGEQVGRAVATAQGELRVRAEALVKVWREDKGALAFAAAVDALATAMESRA